MNDPDHEARTTPSDPHQLAARYLGQRIRVHRADGWHCTQWARICLVVPSTRHTCWLVEYDDGATDVVRVFDNPEHYELATISAEINTKEMSA